MLSRTSRYRDSALFAQDPERPHQFLGIRPRSIATLPPVLEHTLAAWERPDLLALHYYNDSERWWQILDANPEDLFAGHFTASSEHAGTILLIPRDTGR